MLIRLLRDIEIDGRRARAFAPMDLPEETAAAMIAAGDAEPWQPLDRTPAPPPAPAAAPAADQPE